MILAVLQSSVILSLALSAVALPLRRRSAATRHATLTMGLISSLAVPLLGALIPEFPRSRGLYARVQDQTEILWNLGADVTPTPAGLPAPAAAANYPFRPIWLGGMAVAGIVLIAGAGRIAWLVLQSRPLGHEKWIATSKEISDRLRLKRRVRLLQNHSAVLGTWGLLRPKVFLPPDVDAWPDERIRVVLTHEIAHIKRFDWPVQLLAEAARAVYWFNPLFWIACRCLRSESEQACDDVVLNGGIDAKDYAAHLLDLARTLKNSNRAWSPVLAMSRPPNLERRFVAMLNPSVNRRSLTFPAVVAIAAAALCVTLPVAAMRAPQQPPVPLSAPAKVVVPATAPAPAPTAPAPVPVAAKPAVAKPAIAQGLADGTLSGFVYDASGARVPGVAVTVTGQQIETQVATGDAGQYEIRALPPGFYSLAAQLPGFMIARVGRVEIKSSQISQRNITLLPGGVAERVTVNAVGQPKPAPQAPAFPQRIRVGGNIRPPNMIAQVKPVYPQSAREAGIEGTVHLQGVISVEGTLVGLRVVSSNDPSLSVAAIEAVSQWRYRPAFLNGEPVAVTTEIDVDFALTQ
jgi:TonB family protein